MVFSSATFLFLFLPIVLFIYYLSPVKYRNFVLLLASVLFYAFGEPVYVILLLFTSIFNWIISLYIEKHRNEKRSKNAFILSIIINIGILGFFKYLDFILSSINGLLGINIPLMNIPLPIGISFFTFQTMSYTIDIYRGKFHAQKSLVSLMTFVCLFPQLIAGPIVLYGDVVNELDHRKITLDALSLGIQRFVIGLAKKVLIANAMGEICQSFQNANEKTVLFCWIYAIAFMMQLYFDFSGYSDMAIGLGKMFGFHFPENFNYPYMSISITDFWRRWHMTLGGWFREYVYIPMGGNRTTKIKWLRNLAVVWFLTGLWHGAAWNFIIWGLMFGAILIIEKLYLKKYLEKWPRFLQHFYVLFIVMISFIIFNDMPKAQWLSVLQGMFGFDHLQMINLESMYVLKSYFVLFVIAIVGCTDLPRNLYHKLSAKTWMNILEPVLLFVLLLVITGNIVDGSFNPFLYFRF